ncbi:MAG: phnA protein [Deltaproteobacteria bacterium]|nr:phnA protein [Deltaproteobacteria bacterium]
MARGREEHQARLAAVAGLGRVLSRRARSSCELCGEGGTLRVLEVPPVLDTPDVERAGLFCDRCRDLLDGGLMRADPQTVRFLAETVWSDVLPVKLTAVRMLRSLAAAGVPWAGEANENLWLDEDVESLL